MICAVGVFGTTYTRSTAVSASISMPYDTTKSFEVEHISATTTIGNTLAIAVRRNSDSTVTDGAFSFVRDSTKCTVTIDSYWLTAGTYSLILESFDENSGGVESTLETDTISIVVNPVTTNPVAASIPALTAGTSYSLSIIDAGATPTMVATYTNHDSYVSEIGLDYADWDTDYDQTINGVVTDDGGYAYTGVMTISWAGQYSLDVYVSGTSVTGYPQTITVEPDALFGIRCDQSEALPSPI